MDAKFHKNCADQCPSCGATSDDIDYGIINTNESPYYEAECKICGCAFHEIYEYASTAYDGPKPLELSTDKEIEDILTDKESGDSEDWPEFEVMKDAVTDFMADLPIEAYEFLYKATQQEQDKLLEYLMAFDRKS